MTSMKTSYICNRQSLSNIICKKRDGNALTRKEINFFLEAAQIVDSKQYRDDPKAPSECQIGAMLMAMYQQGMNTDETTTLTKALAKSGEVFNWPEEYKHIVVDKHSTGGVGDKVSHVLVPALAACGLKVPMVSTRNSDLPGGTLDKLQAIPGFRTILSKKEMEECLRDVGCFITEQTEDFCPAERTLYRIRDLTATVTSSSLLTASILAKKYAEDLAALVFDVKYGKGALVKTEQEARSLAQRLVSATSELGIKTSALLTSMDSPLGKMIGNTLEMVEALSCLQGGGPADLLEMIEGLGGELLMLTGLSSGREEGATKIHEVLQNGAALAKFQDMILKQGVEPQIARRLCSHGHDIWAILPRAKQLTKLIYEGKKGYVLGLVPDALAQVWKEVAFLNKELNYAAGIELMVQQGDVIHPGTVWVRIHHDQEQIPESQLALLKTALRVGRKNRIKDVITPQTTRQRKITLPPVHVYRETWENAVCEVKGAME